MAKLTKTTTKKAETLFELTKTALAVVEITGAKIQPYGDHALLVTHKKPRSSKYRKVIIHRQNLISAAGGEMDFDGVIMYRGLQEIYSSKGHVTSVDSNSITFTDLSGVKHIVPASTDQQIVLTIFSEDLDKSTVGKKDKAEVKTVGKRVKTKASAAAAAAESTGGKKKTKKVGKFPTRKAKKA
jgi:hypothetical protein